MSVQEKLRIQTQVIIFMVIIYFITISIVVGTLLMNIYFISDIITTSSISILDKQVESQVDFVAKFTTFNIKHIYNRDKAKLIATNQLQQFLFAHQINLPFPEQCIDQFISIFSGKTNLCFGIYGDTSEQNMEVFYSYTNLTALTGYLNLMMDNYFDYLYAGVTKEQYFSLWPAEILNVSKYQPHIRPWYLNHMEKTKQNPTAYYQTYFSPPYKHAVYKTATTSRTMSVYDTKLQIQGVASIQLNFSLSFPTMLIETLNLQAYMIDHDQNILFGANQYDSIKKFSDVNITGFNETDSSIILNTVLDPDIHHMCQDLKSHLPCLRNKITHQDVMVQAQILDEEKQILILAINPQNDINLVKAHKAHMQEQLQQFSLDIIKNSLILFVCCLVLAFLLLYQLTHPLSRLINYTLNMIFQQSSKQQRKVKQTKLPSQTYNFFSTIFGLISAFCHLSTNLASNTQKHDQCLQIESIQQYPLQIETSTRLIRQKNKKLVNNMQFLLNKVKLSSLIHSEKQSQYQKDRLRRSLINFL